MRLRPRNLRHRPAPWRWLLVCAAVALACPLAARADEPPAPPATAEPAPAKPDETPAAPVPAPAPEKPDQQAPAFEYPDWDAPAKPADATAEPAAPVYPAWDQSGAEAAVTDEAVRAALAKGVAYLRTAQGDDGILAGTYHRSYPFGETALSLLAMRYAGVGVTDPAYEKGQRALLEGETEKTYVVSLIAQALATVPRDKRSRPVHRKMTALAAWLARAQLPRGTWTYTQPSPKNPRYGLTSGDNSNTQFAVLALWMLSEAGVEPSRRALERCEKHFLESQISDGGWGYSPPRVYVTQGKRRVVISGSSPSMTATGLATMHIFQNLMHLRDGGPCTKRRLPKGGRNPHMDRRFDIAGRKAESDLSAWFARRKQIAERQAALGNTARQRVAGLSMRDLYYLYGVERVGAASGRKYFGAVDWYADGARLLLSTQNADGSWGYSYAAPRVAPGQPVPPRNLVETALAMLFLAKGRAPVFLNKLQWDGDWNNDPRDVANLTRYAEKALEQHFNWQTIDLAGNVDGWFEAPAMVLNGTQPPEFTPADKRKLVEYVRRGGLLFASACCREQEFVAALKALGTELWPDLQWQPLADDHPLMTRKSHFDLEHRPALWGLTDKKGFTFFIVTDVDLSCLWHQNLILTNEDMFRLAINLYRYASRGKPIRARLDR